MFLKGSPLLHALPFTPVIFNGVPLSSLVPSAGTPASGMGDAPWKSHVGKPNTHTPVLGRRRNSPQSESSEVEVVATPRRISMPGA